MIRLKLELTFAGLKEKTGYVYRRKGESRRGPIFKSTMQYPWEDTWESFPLSPEEFHQIFDCIPSNNFGLNIPRNRLSMMMGTGTLSPTIAKFERAVDKNGNVFQYAKFAAGHYSNGFGVSSAHYEQIYVINSQGEKLCIWEDYELGPEVREYLLP